ncbi:AzlC family ABC transporter permease [Paludibacterium yongneupense]|uniref:AzlC family ABC transporter permease n=1 Tax=Paludibacterium yongneupense TaxID=400061 RepID=UPI000415A581|nr:AzlC family ABC transporter permease [Paludibacterium yongneupense]
MSASLRQCMAGARDSTPMLVGAAPFGLIFGTLSSGAGLTAGATLAMSAFVFAGSAQFIALSLMSGGAGLPVIWLTTLVVNLRHALYSATLLPYARSWPLVWRWPLAFWLTDETFAVVEHRFRAHGGDPWYQLGSSLAMYGNWLLWTALGLLVGHSLPGVAQWGLDFAMVGTFSALVALQLNKRPYLYAALSAAAVALLCRGLPYKLDLLLAAFSGVTAGMLTEKRA